MIIPGIFLGLFCLTVDLRYVQSTGWVKSLGRWLSVFSETHLVRLTTNFGRNRTTPCPEVNEILAELMQRIPTKIDEIEDLRVPSDDDNMFPDTAAKLFVMIEESNDLLNALPSRDSIDVVAKMSDSGLSRFLLILISPKVRESFEPLLHYAWSKNFLYFTIIELTRPEMKIKLVRPPVNWFSEPIVHRYDPFKREYTRKNWSPSDEWFQKKSDNMYGYPLNIAVAHRPPFSYVENDSVRQRPIRMSGVNIEMVKTIAETLNFTPNWIPLTKFRELHRNPNSSGLRELLSSGKIDLIAHTSPHYTTTGKDGISRSSNVMLDSLCAVVPVLPSNEIPAVWDLFGAYAMCFGITLIFWLLRSLFKFHHRIWQPINVMRVLIGVGMARLPTRNVERVMLACVLVVSAIYSSNIFTALTRVSFDTVTTKEINSFEDLDRSGLQPFISTFLYNKTFDHANTDALISIKKKTRTGLSMYNCLREALKHKNVTCLMRMKMAKGIIQSNRKKYKNKIRIVESCCFWTDSHAFLLRQGSPYRDHIAKIIARTQVTGFLGKLFDDTNYAKFVTSASNEDAEGMSTIGGGHKKKEFLYALAAIVIFGYSLSLLVLLGEIIVHRVTKSGKRK